MDQYSDYRALREMERSQQKFREDQRPLRPLPSGDFAGRIPLAVGMLVIGVLALGLWLLMGLL